MKKLLLMLALSFFGALCISPSFAQYEPYTQMGLPEGAIARLGKGTIGDIMYSPDGARFAVSADIGVWIYDAKTGKELDLIAEEHPARVYSAAYSPDSKTIATGGQDKTVRLWNAHTGKHLKTLTGHKDEVNSVAYSPDGQILATGSSDNTIRLWHANSGKYIKTLKGHTQPVSSVQFSSDGDMLASTTRHGIIRFWGMSKGQLKNTFTGYRELISYSPVGKTLLVLPNPDGSNTVFRTKDSDGYITETETLADPDAIYAMHILDIGTGQPIKTISSLNSVNCFASSPDGKTIAISDGERFGLWDATTGKYLKTLSEETPEVQSIAYSPDGNTIATVRWDRVQWWNAQTGENIKTFPSSIDNFGAIRFSPDGKTIAISEGSEISLLHTNSGKHFTTLEGHKAYISGFAFSPDSKTIATGSNDGTARLWDANTGENLKIFNMEHTKHRNEFVRIDPPKFSPDGKILAFRSNHNTLWLWNMQLEYIKRTIPGEHYHTREFVFSNDGKILATRSKTEAIHLWNTETGQHINTLTGLVHSLTFSPNGNTLGTNVDNFVQIWHTATGENLIELFIPNVCNTQVIYTETGNPLAITIHQNESVALWDITTGKHIQAFEGDMNEALAALGRSFFRMTNKTIIGSWNTELVLSPTQDTFVTVVEHNPVRLWNITTRKQIGKSIKSLKGEKSYTLVQYSPDGKTIATIPIGPDRQGGTVRLWDVATGEHLKTLNGYSNCDFQSVTFSPDSKIIATGHKDGTVLIWDIPQR